MALVLSTLVDCVLGLIYFGSSAAFNSFTGCATICLSCSYGIPILVSLIRGRHAVKHSTFSLGRFGFVINAATICWIVLAIVLFCMPTSIPVTAPGMNYASVVFAFFALVSIIWYAVRGRKVFTGPPVPTDVEPQDDGVPPGEGVFGKVVTQSRESSNDESEMKEEEKAEKVRR
jgi:amino acid transporter